MSAMETQNQWGRWIIYIVAAIVAAFLIEYVWGGGSAGYALVMGVATGLAVDIADVIIMNA